MRRSSARAGELCSTAGDDDAAAGSGAPRPQCAGALAKVHPQQGDPLKEAPGIFRIMADEQPANGEGQVSLHGETAARRQAITELLFFASVGDTYRCKKIVSAWGLHVRNCRRGYVRAGSRSLLQRSPFWGGVESAQLRMVVGRASSASSAQLSASWCTLRACCPLRAVDGPQDRRLRE